MPGEASRGGPGRGASRRALLAGTVAGLATGGTVPGPNHDFVAVRGGKFHVGGQPWRFGGTNTYYLHQQSHYMIDSALNDAAAMSLSVVRAWAFADGSGKGHTPLQPEPYVYDNAAFDSLDYAIAKAAQLGLRLVLGLTNNWPDYGGMAQYVTWFLGLPDDSYGDMTNHDKFYTTQSIQNCYLAYVKYVLTRYNRYTGLRYNQDPTIMTWELANEPRARSDKSGQTLYPDYDGYRIIWDNDPSNTTSSTAQLLSAHAKAMAAAS